MWTTILSIFGFLKEIFGFIKPYIDKDIQNAKDTTDAIKNNAESASPSIESHDKFKQQMEELKKQGLTEEDILSGVSSTVRGKPESGPTA